jgi:hypothetical protein
MGKYTKGVDSRSVPELLAEAYHTLVTWSIAPKKASHRKVSIALELFTEAIKDPCAFVSVVIFSRKGSFEKNIDGSGCFGRSG